MKFYAFGVNHLRAPVQVREQFALDETGARGLLRSVHLAPESELLLLSTCNRTEAYLYGRAEDRQAVIEALCMRAGCDWPDHQAFALEDEAAIRQVIRVACGLESLVLGDAQIFAQLKDAYRIAVDEERVGTSMHRLMHTAFRAAKRVINETGLNTGSASVPRVAVEVARTRRNAELAEARVLLVGAGAMAREAADALRSEGVTELLVANRSPERAVRLASAVGATVLPWEERHAASGSADLVIVATAADEPVLLGCQMPVRRSEAPALVIDLCVPRNVERTVDVLPGYAVIDLDDLNGYLVQTEFTRRAAVPAAEGICEEMLAEYVAWVFHQQALQPVIDAIRETFDQIRRQEVERHHHRISGIDRQELDRLTQSIIQKLLAVPVVRLKNVGPENVDFHNGIKLLYALFSRPGCEDDAASALTASLGAMRPHQEESCPYMGGDAEQTLAPKPLHEAVREVLRRDGAGQ